MARKAPMGTTLTVLRTEAIGEHFVRVVLGGDGFGEFQARAETDSYVKIELPAGEETVVRTYTVRRVDSDAREIWIDFVVHGDEGVAGPWARSVQPGAQVVVRGPARDTGPIAPPTSICSPATRPRSPRSRLRSRTCPPTRVGRSSWRSSVPATN